MIGRFPEAQILRRWPWAPAFEKAIAGVATIGRRYLAVDPELVAGSADIVLADLTGHWEDVYQPSVTTRALYMLPTGASADSAGWLRLDDEITGTVVELEPEQTTTDVFYLDEAQVEMTLVKPVSRVRIRRFRADPEVSAANRPRPNPIAFPEITVSRINAYHVAVRLLAESEPGHRHDRADPVRRHHDTAGKPAMFTSTVNDATEPTADPAVWVIGPDEFAPDPALERQLINEYLDRNHRYRTGTWPTRPGSIAAVAPGQRRVHRVGRRRRVGASAARRGANGRAGSVAGRIRHRVGPARSAAGDRRAQRRAPVPVPGDDVEHRGG
jgi:hypothetical protein